MEEKKNERRYLDKIQPRSTRFTDEIFPRIIPKSYADKVRRSCKDIYKIVGQDITGQTAWYYVKVDKGKEREFLKNKPGSSYNLEDYGVIIESGYGEVVPKDKRRELYEKYGIDNF